ncbi:MAG TPA: hypothetical protein VHD90_05135 [Phototrophicaceae bacterium]|nr:hypothetical protein [Phototrophicaceae bacterium]
MKKLFLATLLLAAIIIAGVGVSTTSAQTTNTTPTPVATSNGTPTGPTNSVTGNLIICADSAVLDFSGTMLSGYDIVYQLFASADASGTALTAIRHVAAVGTGFAVSDRALYTNGQTVATGASGSAKVIVQNERNGKADFTFTMTDVQDGCNNPANPLVSTADTAPGSTSANATPGASSGSSATSTDSGQQGAGITVSIFAPNGGTLNPNLAPEAPVVVGPRPSDRFRSETPGLIFAQCDAYPLALPGIIYDTDTITIFWSWYTRTNAEMSQELANALYTVHLNTASLPMTALSTPVARSGNVWVFYTATVGNLRPGHYEVGFLHTWANPVNDGYNDYGPGTARPDDKGTCNFDVQPNPDGTSVAYSGMYFPSLYATHNLFPNR